MERTGFQYALFGRQNMAITKLMHLKEAPAVPHRHLANAVQYILDEKNNEAKTCDGLYVGGNAGYNSEDIIKTFLDTKELYGKLHGRQGYHFVISFEPGETDADEAYEITKEFAKKYLGENYDYVFATHTDKNHIHSHLIFNSVSRTDGYKYRYENGDWERYIQPVTDEICMEHGLKPLKFEENKKKGLSYAEWNEKKNGRMNWTHVIRADIDLASKHSDTLPEFMEHMKMAGYSVRAGKSKKKNATYFTYTYTDDAGKKHRRRSYNMPSGYSPEDIAKRIKQKSGSRMYEEIAENLEKKEKLASIDEIYKNTGTYRRLYQAVSFYRLPNPYAVTKGVRRDIMAIDRLLDECAYIKKNSLQTMNNIQDRESRLEEMINSLKREKWNKKDASEALDSGQKKQLERKEQIENELKNPDISDEAFEALQDEYEQLKEQLPDDDISKKDMERLSQEIKELGKELRMLRRIKKTEQEFTGRKTKQVSRVPESGTFNKKI